MRLNTKLHFAIIATAVALVSCNKDGDAPDPWEGIFKENLQEKYFEYYGVRYPIVNLKDGKWWMASNLAYLPDGMTASTDLTQTAAGVFAPVRINAEHTAAEFTTDAKDIASNGYLYQAEVALGLKPGALKNEEHAKALEGMRGICPPGWHVPTIADISGLVGKVASLETVESAPYYNGSDCTIKALNADGFNMNSVGGVSIIDKTKTAGTFMGFMKAYPDRLSSSMFCGSSFASFTKNEDGSVKNIQFYGLMPMTNKASEDQYTCNGTKVSFLIGAPLRCVRDQENQ